ncbi:MAG: helix-turn-helix domain-containing protein [Magnetospiraceae bacterium]
MNEVSQIIEIVSQQTGISRKRILSAQRMAGVVRARHAIMYVACTQTEKSLPMIGRALGRDHTTILHGYRKVKSRLRDDEDLAVLVAETIMILESRI